VKGELASGGRHDLAGEEFPDRLEQFARGRPSVWGRDWLPGARDAWTAGGGLRRGIGLEQEQQIPFLLADPPPDRGQLDGPVRAGQMRLGLLQADDSPAQRAEYLPPAQLVKGDLGSARGAVGGQQLFPAAQPGGRRGRAEPPRLDAEPAEVLGWVASVDEFPVDDGAQRVRADDEVAEPQVAVDDHRWAGRRWVRLQRAQGQLKDRAGLLIGGELGPQAGQRVRRGQIPGDLQCVQAGGELAGLAHQHAACLAVGGVAQDAAGDRLASDAAHDQASRAPQAGLIGAEQYLRHGEPGRPGRFDDAGFPAHRPRFVRAPRRVAAQHQFRARSVRAHRIERPGFPGGAAGQPGQALDGSHAQGVAQCVGKGAFCKVAFCCQSVVTPLGARWRMYPNMYPATRRICISSVPSVIR
jgi:hypothetical protein